MKVILYGDQEHEPVPEQYQQLATEVFNCGLISRLITNLPSFEFEVSPHCPAAAACITMME